MFLEIFEKSSGGGLGTERVEVGVVFCCISCMQAL